MTWKSMFYGKKAEHFAAQYLRKNGYEILDANFKTRMGEIDLVARNKGYLVFVEVKARQSDDYGGPAGAMTLAKQRKIARMAKAYLACKNIDSDVRFDVVLIRGSIHAPSAELIQNAFEMR